MQRWPSLCIWLLPSSHDLFGPDAQNWDSWVCSLWGGWFECGGGASFLPGLTGSSPRLLAPPGSILDSAAQPIILQLSKQLVAMTTSTSWGRRIESGLWQGRAGGCRQGWVGPGQWGAQCRRSGAPFRALAPSPGDSLACSRGRQRGSRSSSASYSRVTLDLSLDI